MNVLFRLIIQASFAKLPSPINTIMGDIDIESFAPFEVFENLRIRRNYKNEISYFRILTISKRKGKGLGLRKNNLVL